MSQEKLQILSMISEGKISAEEGMKLLGAVEVDTKKINTKDTNRKYLRVRIYVPGEETKVNATIPISIFRMGLKFASRFSPQLGEIGLSEANLEEILQAVDSEQIGKIVEIDTNDGTKVEIVVK